MIVVPGSAEWVTLPAWLVTLSAWLVTTAKRECWSRRRGADYERLQIVDPEKLPEPGQAIEDATPEEIVSRFENESKLRAAMRELGDRCRQLLWYLYDAPSKPSYDEIAERLSMPKGAIGPNRARCLKQLRGMLRGK